MKRFLILLPALHAIGIALSFPAFLVAYRILEPSSPSTPPDLLWMPLGLCLIVFAVRGLFIALPIAVLLAFRPTVVSAVIGVLFASWVSWSLVGGYSGRDRSLAIAGAISYGVATLLSQQFMSRRRQAPNATTVA
jgi:hypothetical protein